MLSRSDSDRSKYNRLNLIPSFIDILQKISAVGTPVTQRPPHSPGRAVFPHPVPRLYSLPRKAVALYKYSMFSGDHHHLRLGNSQPVYGPGEHIPAKAFTLSTSSV